MNKIILLVILFISAISICWAGSGAEDVLEKNLPIPVAEASAYLVTDSNDYLPPVKLGNGSMWIHSGDSCGFPIIERGICIGHLHLGARKTGCQIQLFDNFDKSDNNEMLFSWIPIGQTQRFCLRGVCFRATCEPCGAILLKKEEERK